MRRCYLVCYDVREPRRLRRVHRLLKGYGEPWQFSVFFCPIKEIDRVRLERQLREIINLKEDEVLLLSLDADTEVARARASVLGLGRPLPSASVVVIWGLASRDPRVLAFRGHPRDDGISQYVSSLKRVSPAAGLLPNPFLDFYVGERLGRWWGLPRCSRFWSSCRFARYGSEHWRTPKEVLPTRESLAKPEPSVWLLVWKVWSGRLRHGFGLPVTLICPICNRGRRECRLRHGFGLPVTQRYGDLYLTTLAVVFATDSDCRWH